MQVGSMRAPKAAACSAGFRVQAAHSAWPAIGAALTSHGGEWLLL